MRFNKIILPFILSSVFMSEMANANEMKKVFDYYAQGTPGTYDSGRMKHWMGASFSGRNALREPDLIQLPTINIGGSCKGLDFHASGFGLVTKDEIVQMARGIAQGAPGYFFNMAIGAVCSSCLQNINEYMRKLEQFNQLTRNSCEKFWDKASELAGVPEDRIRGNANAKGLLDDAVQGKLKDWGSSLDRAFNAVEAGLSIEGVSEENAAKVLNENVVFGRIKDVFQTNVISTMFPNTNISTAEMAMSLFGTVITETIPGKTTEIVVNPLPPSKNVNPYNLVFKNETADKIHFYKCDDTAKPAAEQQCLKPVETEDATFVGMYEFFLVQLNGKSGTKGIIEKIAHREDVGPTELEFIKSFEMPYVKIAQISSPALRKQMGERFAYLLAQQFVNDLYRETNIVVFKAFRAQTTKTKTLDHKMTIEKFVEEANKGLELMDKEVALQIDKIDKTLTTLAAVQALQGLNVGVRQ